MKIAFIAGALLAFAAAGSPAQELKVLRIAPHADLKILDPVWTTAFITRNHGYSVYDTLFGIDEQGRVQPQMVGRFSNSADGLNWSFTLRSGLAFHDGAPVTATDVVASLQRWGQRDVLGQQMFAAVARIEAVDANSFRIDFKSPFPLVREALGKPGSTAPFIMPRRVAETPADRQIDDPTGSGPYIFKADEYRPGEKVVYLKNTRYLPRDEPPSGTAGGKQVYVDRMEWRILRDAQTQASALVRGEIDMIETVPFEQYLALKANPQIGLHSIVDKGSYALHLNHLQPPFDNPKIARAALMAINQEALLRAQVVHKDLYNTCTSIYPCGSLYASERTAWFTGKPQFEQARALLQEAGYDGRPVVLLHAAEVASINKFPPVLAQLLREAGFKVDLQTMDWASLVTRRARKDPADQGGWNLFVTAWGGADGLNPLYLSHLTGNGEKGWFGWPTDTRLEQLKAEFAVTADEDRRKELAAQIQEQVYTAAIYANIGEYQPVSAYRKGSVSGMIKAPVNVFWNLRKE